MEITIENKVRLHLEARGSCSCVAGYTWFPILQEKTERVLLRCELHTVNDSWKKENRQARVLMKPLYESFEVIVQDSAFLRLNRAK